MLTSSVRDLIWHSIETEAASVLIGGEPEDGVVPLTIVMLVWSSDSPHFISHARVSSVPFWRLHELLLNRSRWGLAPTPCSGGRSNLSSSLSFLSSA